jgi:hypothetical protein
MNTKNFNWAWLCTLGCMLTFSTAGCYSGMDASHANGGDASAGGSNSDTAGSGDDDGDDDDDIVESELPAPTTRVFRLTHEQWENTIADLFFLDEHTGASEYFRADPASSGFIFENNVLAMEVDQALWSGYGFAAAHVAELVTSDPALMAAILPPDGGDDAARARAFIEELALRAFRRPATEADIQAYVAQFNDAGSLYEGVDAFTAGVRLVIESMLQSPKFLYRIEQSTEVVGEVIPLDDWEIASRLSYFLWNTMPDDELFDVAAAGELVSPSTVEAQALRMISDPRAAGVVQSFHRQLLNTEKFAGVTPSPAFYPDAPEALGHLATVENQMFIHDIVFETQGSFADLMTSTETFVNAELAAIYGVQGNVGDDFQKVALDPSQRRGLFTQVGFLAANASSVSPDPIHRGVFLIERITCMHLPAPPDDIPPLPELDETRTNRQLVADHTEAPGSVCAGCHSGLINPYGFPFENYDSLGAWRTTDNNQTVDATSTVILDGGQVPVQNALELIEALAASPSVHECYVRHWQEFAHGRLYAPEDQGLVIRLADGSRQENVPIHEVIVGLVKSQPFLTRSPQELEDSP